MPRRTRTPQEKKALSYARDRRNSYGESDKGSRKRIRRRKRDRVRIPRRRVRHALAAAAEPLPDAIVEVAEDLEGRINDVGVAGWWGKCPDEPLRDHVAYVLERRADFERYARASWPPA